MKFKPTFACVRIWTLLAVTVFFVSAASSHAGAPKFEARLVWATNDEKPADGKCKRVDPETQKKLESLGLKWKHFYEVKKVEFDVPKNESKKIDISDKCAISVKVLESKKIEVVFFGKDDKECSRHRQVLKTGEILVHGGKVPGDSTAWLVTLKRLK